MKTDDIDKKKNNDDSDVAVAFTKGGASSAVKSVLNAVNTVKGVPGGGHSIPAIRKIAKDSEMKLLSLEEQIVVTSNVSCGDGEYLFCQKDGVVYIYGNDSEKFSTTKEGKTKVQDARGILSIDLSTMNGYVATGVKVVSFKRLFKVLAEYM